MGDCSGHCERQVHEIEVTAAAIMNLDELDDPKYIAPRPPKEFLVIYFEEIEDEIERQKDRTIDGCETHEAPAKPGAKGGDHGTGTGCECKEIDPPEKVHWPVSERYTDEIVVYPKTYEGKDSSNTTVTRTFPFKLKVTYTLKARIYKGICIDRPSAAPAPKTYKGKTAKAEKKG